MQYMNSKSLSKHSSLHRLNHHQRTLLRFGLWALFIITISTIIHLYLQSNTLSSVPMCVCGGGGGKVHLIYVDFPSRILSDRVMFLVSSVGRYIFFFILKAFSYYNNMA